MLVSSRVSVDFGIILKNLRHHEKKRDYKTFLSKDELDRGRKFLSLHRTLFQNVERRYRVPKEVLTAILLVESSLGELREKYRVLEVYVSLASLMDHGIQEETFQRMRMEGMDVQRIDFLHHIRRKTAWGLRQLICLLRLDEERKIDAIHLKGSWAGAFGIPQFIPTSFERYGVDWDRDGQVKLNHLPDAVASVAYYLKVNGWKDKLGIKGARSVIRRYNHSTPYVETIMEISKKLQR